MMRRDWRLFCCAVLLFGGLGGCGRDEPSVAETGGVQQKSSAATITNRVDIPPTVRSNLGITFAKVERRRVANTIRVPGAFELEPLARHEYRLMLPGHVAFAVDQFQKVEVGTVLFRFRSPVWPELQHEMVKAEEQIASARARIEVAEASLGESRAKLQVVENRIAALSGADFKRAELDMQVAELRASVPKQEAILRAAKTSLSNAERSLAHAAHRAGEAVGLKPADLLTSVNDGDRTIARYQTIDSIEVRAKEAGVVETLSVTDGAFVEATTLVVTTVDPKRLRFRALGLQSDLGKFKDRQEVRIVPARSMSVDLSESIEGELTVGLNGDPVHRTVVLFGKPKTLAAWTRAGVSAFMEIVTESSRGPVLAVPRSAVVKDGLAHVFFRRDPSNPNLAIREEADLGVSDGRWVEMKSGVGPNDEVVLNGVYELKLATATSGARQKGGHFHADGSFHGDH